MSESHVRCPVSGQSHLEELLNTWTHGLGFAASVVGLAVLLYLGADQLWTVVVYGLSLVLLYAASMLYHGCRCSTRKRLLQKLDHCAIYLLIAGTYTPLMLGPLYQSWGWILAIAVWSMAAFGILWRLVLPWTIEWISTGMYLVMGWMAVLAIGPMLETLSTSALTWIFLGGASYTLGVLFYAWESLPFSHVIWHLFVLGGSASHFACIAFCIDV